MVNKKNYTHYDDVGFQVCKPGLALKKTYISYEL